MCNCRKPAPPKKAVTPAPVPQAPVPAPATDWKARSPLLRTR